MKNGYPEYAILSNAMDGYDDAYKWLVKHNMTFYVVFADACRNKPKAIAWLKEHKFDVFLIVAEKIYQVLEKQRRDFHDPHKVRFS